MTAPARVTPARSRRTGLAAIVALAQLVAVTVALGCAGGGDDPGVAPDRCKARDCGPSSGGPEADQLDSDEEFDTEFPPPDDTAIPDTLRPADTAVDAAAADTKADTAAKV